MAKDNSNNIFKRIAETGSNVRAFLRNDTVRFMGGLILVCVSIYFTVAFVSFFSTGAQDFSIVQGGDAGGGASNLGGGQGARISNFFINETFGIGSFFIMVFLFVCGLKAMNVFKAKLLRWFFGCALLMVWLSLFLGHAFFEVYKSTFVYWGGRHGLDVSQWLVRQIGEMGFWMLLAAAAVCIAIFFNKNTVEAIKRLLSFKKKEKTNRQADKAAQSDDEPEGEMGDGLGGIAPEKPARATSDAGEMPIVGDAPAVSPYADLPSSDTSARCCAAQAGATVPETVSAPTEGVEMEVEIHADEVVDADSARQHIEITEPYDPRKDLSRFQFPSIDLLEKYDDSEPSVDRLELEENKKNIIRVLKSFGIEISTIKATVGPTVTLYEITPEAGIRISKIKGLEDDIALNLKARGIRIIAPMPGKGTIGIEVPNSKPKIVPMQSLIASRRFQETTYDLPVVFGKTITNEVFMVDLAKMPHILVAGATGQGKSVGLNAIITSLLYKKHPAELKFVMIDPKKVEFSIYSTIEKHYLAKLPDAEDPIITDVTKVINTLNSLCIEMDSRYDLLKTAHVRNIKEYNQKFISRQLNPENGHRYMPYIVVIIDEFGDLIMTAGKEIELPIARIAQLARAVGIHMVIATQRPTTQIITGTIKANFPARVAFRVASMIDSRTIIDRPGANQLIGRGDMLFLQGTEPVRVQCAFVDTPEVERITQFIQHQQGYMSAFLLPEYVGENADGSSSAGDFDVNKLDPIFEEAARLIIVHQQGSTSLIQRKFSIGYNRAGRIMDQLEKAGIVGPAEGSKPRQVMCADENDLQMKLSNLK